MFQKPAARLSPLRFSTRDLPAREQFAAYQAATSGVFGVDPLGGVAPASFAAEQLVWPFGPLALRRLRDNGVRYERTAKQARRDMLDHWSVTLYLGGGARGVVAGAEYASEGDAPLLYGLQQPLSSERGRSDLLTLFIPRTALPEVSMDFDARSGQTLATPLGRLLASYMANLTETFEHLAVEDTARVAEATLAVLRAAITGGRDQVEAARPTLEAAMRARLLALIQGNIRSARLDPARLARLAGMSRSSVYRVFEAEGGVARAIQRERLRLIAAALSDPAETRSIRSIAEDFGMPEPSAFSRVFRRDFDLTPREFRESAALGRGPQAPLGPIVQILHGLRG